MDKKNIFIFKKSLFYFILMIFLQLNIIIIIRVLLSTKEIFGVY